MIPAVQTTRCLFPLAALLTVLVAPARADDPPPPQLKPAFLAHPPVINGRLGDACWAQATHVEGFYYSTQNRPEPERTEAWLGHDARYLYAAFYCHDSKPGTIRSEQTQRNGAVDRDDYMALHVDATRRQVEHYSFRVTANGCQNDTIPNSGSTNIAWAGDWLGAGRRVADGYTVEIAVPLAILTYPAGQNTLGIAFGRNLQREREADMWPLMHDRFENKKMAVYGPLVLPPPQNPPAIMPYGITRLDKRGVTFQSGLDLKYFSRVGATAMFCANPDFRNIEDVVDTIAYSDTPRLLGETRPFFNEGSRFFPVSTALNTRNIPGINTGAKSFGQIGPHEFGVFSTYGYRGRVDAAGGYNYKFTPDHSVGAGFVYTQGGRPNNLVTQAQFSGFHPLGVASLSYSGEAHHSFTRGGGGEGNAFAVRASYSGEGVLGWNASYTFVDPTFKAALGYVPEPDSRGWSIGLSGGRTTMGQTVETHSWSLSHSQRGKSDGRLLHQGTSLNADVRWDNGTSTGLRLYAAHRPPNTDRTAGLLYRWGLKTLRQEGGLEAQYGRRGGAHYLYLKFDQGWQPMPSLRFSLISEYTRRAFFDVTKPRDAFTQNFLTAYYDFDAYTTASLRFIERRGKLNLFLAYRSQPKSGRAWSIFVGDPNAWRTQNIVQFKMTWPL